EKPQFYSVTLVLSPYGYHILYRARTTHGSGLKTPCYPDPPFTWLRAVNLVLLPLTFTRSTLFKPTIPLGRQSSSASIFKNHSHTIMPFLTSPSPNISEPDMSTATMEPAQPLVHLENPQRDELLDIIDTLRSQGIGKYVDLPQLIVC